MKKRPQAVILLSGGLDSATTLFFARREGYDCNCLIFDYGQRHKKEIARARRLARRARSRSTVVRISLPWKGSSLLDRKLPIPERRTPREIQKKIPSTYVPARNTIFIAYALSYSESIGARAVFIGAHAQDSSGYPDCRKKYFHAFQETARLGTRQGVEGKGIEIITPLITMSKREIIELGAALQVPFRLTWSCYYGGSSPCGVCDSCLLRKKGFKEAGIDDPLIAQE